ncbi:MAG: VirB8/TrbF family protein [Leptospirillia bacterium]
MKSFEGESPEEEMGEERPLWTAPSIYGSREEILKGFRQIRRLVIGALILGVVNTLGIVLLSGDHTLVVGLSSDGRMQVLTPLSDEVFRKNLERISRSFVEDFLMNLTAYDSFEISYRIGKALAVMSPDLRLRMKRVILSQNLVESVSRARIHTVLSIRSFSMHPVRRDIWSVEVSGVRTTYAQGNSEGRSQGFSARLLLSRGAPTPGNPYGLWVSRYQEEVQSTPVGEGPPR